MEKHYILYLIGTPGTGKYTISQELAKSGYVVCDNQLINNVIFTLGQYDGFVPIPDSAWAAIRKIRDIAINFIEDQIDKNYVLTNVLSESIGDRKIYEQVEKMAANRGAVFVPVKLLISKEENLKRVVQLSRKERWKTINPKDIELELPLITISHSNYLEMDVTNMSVHKAAKKILEHVASL